MASGSTHRARAISRRAQQGSGRGREVPSLSRRAGGLVDATICTPRRRAPSGAVSPLGRRSLARPIGEKLASDLAARSPSSRRLARPIATVARRRIALRLSPPPRVRAMRARVASRPEHYMPTAGRQFATRSRPGRGRRLEIAADSDLRHSVPRLAARLPADVARRGRPS